VDQKVELFDYEDALMVALRIYAERRRRKENSGVRELPPALSVPEKEEQIRAVKETTPQESEIPN